MKHILLPTDFSRNSWNALFTALKLYANTSCTFYLLHAYEPKTGELLGKKAKARLGVLYDSMETYSSRELDKIIDYLNKNHTDKLHRFEKISVEDDLLEAIQDILKKKEINLLVMGTQGASGVKEVFLGSNTVKVIKKVDTHPIIAIPEDFNLQSLTKVVFPTEYNHPYNRNELAALIELLQLWEAKLLVFHLAAEFELSETQQSVSHNLSKRLEGMDIGYHEVDRTAPLAEAIGEFATEQGAEMIALVKYGHTFLERLTREPVVRKLSFQAKVPLFILPGR